MRLGTAAFVIFASSALFAQDEEAKRKFFSAVHTALALKPGAVIADVGSGDDPLHALRISTVVGPAGRVVCVDTDQQALDKLQQRLPAGTRNIEGGA